jgi:energy-coupling factor transporter ATP-binding protein EcfA2
MKKIIFNNFVSNLNNGCDSDDDSDNNSDKDSNNNSTNDGNNVDKNNDDIENDKEEDIFEDFINSYYRKRLKLNPVNENTNRYIKIINCKNILCDHIKHDEEWHLNNIVQIKKINNIDDLINLSDYYHCKMRKNYNDIELDKLFGIRENLIELKEMIGLQNIKEEIVNLIIYLLMIYIKGKNINDMLHFVITGSPGCGKTTFIEILAKILTKLHILKTGHIVKVKRSDLIGKYLGHTAVQTQKKIDEAKGGILLIDEAYSLGNPEQRDSFSKECLDTLNQALSENKHEFICIIAGYANALDSSFFSYNEGLRRRFPFRFDIKSYSSDELSLILNKKIIEYGYYEIKYDISELKKLIKDNAKYFINQGGDMESLFLNIKIIHNKRVFLLPVKEKNILIIDDIKNAIKKFILLKGDYINNFEIKEYLSYIYT